jgi:hypothetical protein
MDSATVITPRAVPLHEVRVHRIGKEEDMGLCRKGAMPRARVYHDLGLGVQLKQANMAAFCLP